MSPQSDELLKELIRIQGRLVEAVVGRKEPEMAPTPTPGGPQLLMFERSSKVG